MSKDNFQYKENTVQKQSIDKSEGRVCISCSCVNDSDSFFCQECGIKFEGSGKPCPVCGEFNSGVYCSFCGSNTEGYLCPSCGAEGYCDFCQECGTAVTQFAVELLQNDPDMPEYKKILSDAEVEQIKKTMLGSISSDALKEIEKSRQRIILLKEREYFDEREKRIEDHLTSGRKKVKNISREEMIRIKQAAEKLRIITDSESERIADVLNRKEEEEEKNRDEQRKNEMVEIVNGSWIHIAPWGYCLMTFLCRGSTIQGSTFLDCPKGQNINTISGTIEGENIHFYVSGCSGRECENHAIMKFSGRISGTNMSGYMNYMKTVEQGVFVKNS